MLRSVLESAVLHGVLISAILFLSQSQLFKAETENKQTENIIISTSILKTAKPEPPAAPTVQPETPKPPVSRPQPVKRETSKTETIKLKAALASPETAPHAAEQSAPALSEETTGTADASADPAPSGASAENTGKYAAKHSHSAEELAETYKTEHFRYILASIRSNLKYPVIARKNGWEGRVDVSFIIKKSGHIENLTVSSSCGFKALDESALAAVRAAVPYPPPPVEANIIVPLVFGLK
ncbi:energy transducer TonB [Geovibrio ferrireducens]|uniref:energy transducer TonB n=1 Tax=Geovibrio ferrireducens TaxID=46201 RepID=UPI002247B623|nr:energy transducer TonB [Geovibrio ferrireducens]